MNDIPILLTPEISAKYIMICSIENEWRFGFVRRNPDQEEFFWRVEGWFLGYWKLN